MEWSGVRVEWGRYDNIIIILLCGVGGLCGFGNYGGMLIVLYHDYYTDSEPPVKYHKNSLLMN